MKARHILIEPSIILSENKAKKILTEFLEQVKSGEQDFADLAKEHSEDPGSALRGGELGWANPDIYAPKFKETLATLEKRRNQSAIPFSIWLAHSAVARRKNFGRNRKKANKTKLTKCYTKEKFAEEAENWLREIRDEAFIEVMTE